MPIAVPRAPVLAIISAVKGPIPAKIPAIPKPVKNIVASSTLGSDRITRKPTEIAPISR